MKLFTVGPVQMYDNTLKIGGQQTPYFRCQEFSDVMLRCQDNLLKLLDTDTSQFKAVFLTASGTAAMEAAICAVPKDKKVIIINGGTFGTRFVEICNLHGIEYIEVKVNSDEDLSVEHLNKIDTTDCFALVVNIHETSIGKLYDKELIKDFCKKNNLHLICDAISSFLADPYSLDSFPADITIISSQKGLALPAGIAILVIKNDYYENYIKDSKSTSYYLDLNAHSINMKRGQTPYTPAITIIHQLDDRLTQLLNTGIDNELKHREELASYFRANLPANYTIPNYSLSNCLTPVICTKNNAKLIYEELKNNHNIFVNPCGGQNADRIIRIGHIGNLNKDDFDELIKLLGGF